MERHRAPAKLEGAARLGTVRRGHHRHHHHCTIWEASSSSGIDSSLQIATDQVGQWTVSYNMALNYDKTKELRICFKKSTPDIALLTIDGRPIQQVNSTRPLGLTLDMNTSIVRSVFQYACQVWHTSLTKSKQNR